MPYATLKVCAGATASTALIAAVVTANWATSRYGFIPVGFGQTATAGTFAVGFALAARDAIQDSIGKTWMLTALTAAAALSYLVADPHIATASAAAFLISELARFRGLHPTSGDHSHLGNPRWATAVALSGVAGAIADTSGLPRQSRSARQSILPAMAGQLIGKTWATLAYLIIGKAASVAVLREPDWQQANA